MDLGAIKWDGAGLVAVVVQEARTGEVRMVGWANSEAVKRTVETGEGWFWSRSRAELWRKGGSSGNTLAVREVWADCDADALVYVAEAAGPTCHTGRQSCFFRPVTASGVAEGDGASAAPVLLTLGRELEARKAAATATKSYTKSLLEAGVGRIGEKVREEADEYARALAGEADERVVSEAADVVYHLMVGLLARGRSLADVAQELARRAGTSGHEEKASRS